MTFDEWIYSEATKEYRFDKTDPMYQVGYRFYDRKQALQMASSKKHYEKVMTDLLDVRSSLVQAKYCGGIEGQLNMAKFERVEDNLKELRAEYLKCMEAREALEKEYKEVA
jgi:hypothetical protein